MGAGALLRLLFLTNDLGGGGAEKVLVNVANGLAKMGHDVTVRALVAGGVNRPYLSSSVKYESLFKKGFRGLGYLHVLPHKAIYSYICQGQYDIIIPFVHGTLTRIVSYAPPRQRTVAWLHANMEKSPFMMRLVKEGREKQCFETYYRIIACSETVKASFIKMTGLKDNVQVLYNVFDIEGIRKKASEKDEEPLFKCNSLKIVSVGKLESVKGYKRLLKVLERLVHKDQLNLSLLIVGEGSERSELESYIQQHDLQEIVSLPGYDMNPYKYIANADCFVCSSLSEGFSSVVAESLILGTPVVATDCSGMKEMLGENEYGIIVENSEEGLYKGLHQFIRDRESWKMKAESRGAFFSTEETVKAIEKMLFEVKNA